MVRKSPLPSAATTIPSRAAGEASTVNASTSTWPVAEAAGAAVATRPTLAPIQRPGWATKAGPRRVKPRPSALEEKRAMAWGAMATRRCSGAPSTGTPSSSTSAAPRSDPRAVARTRRNPFAVRWTASSA